MFKRLPTRFKLWKSGQKCLRNLCENQQKKQFLSNKEGLEGVREILKKIFLKSTQQNSKPTLCH